MTLDAAVRKPQKRRATQGGLVSQRGAASTKWLSKRGGSSFTTGSRTGSARRWRRSIAPRCPSAPRSWPVRSHTPHGTRLNLLARRAGSCCPGRSSSSTYGTYGRSRCGSNPCSSPARRTPGRRSPRRHRARVSCTPARTRAAGCCRHSGRCSNNPAPYTSPCTEPGPSRW